MFLSYFVLTVLRLFTTYLFPFFTFILPLLFGESIVFCIINTSIFTVVSFLVWNKEIVEVIHGRY